MAGHKNHRLENYTFLQERNLTKNLWSQKVQKVELQKVELQKVEWQKVELQKVERSKGRINKR